MRLPQPTPRHNRAPRQFRAARLAQPDTGWFRHRNFRPAETLLRRKPPAHFGAPPLSVRQRAKPRACYRALAAAVAVDAATRATRPFSTRAALPWEAPE